MKKSRSFIAIPPGVTIKEQLVERGMKQKEFALRMGMSEKHISKLINGEVQLTVETARKLEMVLGIPTQFWCNLESIYREDIIRVNEENAMGEDIQIADRMPYDKMVSNGWVVEVVKNTEKVIHLRKYFELAELKLLQTTLLPRIACRKLSGSEKSDYELIAWAQKARIEARNIETKAINVDKLKEQFPEVKQILMCDIDEFCLRIKRLFAECGIAVVFLPPMGDGVLHGATFLDNEKIVMGLTLCKESRKELIYSLFHEMAHILYGHIEKTDGISEDDEKCADMFARKMISELL